jgi:hypothetical protein
MWDLLFPRVLMIQFKIAVINLTTTGWAEPYFIFCLPIPQYIGSVPQAYHVNSVHEHTCLSKVISYVNVYC